MSEGRAEIYLGVRNAALRKGLDEAKRWVADFRSELGGQLAGALAFGGIMAGIGHVIEYAKQIRNLSDSFGVSTTVLQQWGVVLEQSGQDVSELAGIFNDLEIARSEAVAGDDDMIKQFKALGVSVQELRDMGVDQIMMKIANGTMEASAMSRVMGEEAIRLRPALKALAEGSIELGGAMEDDTVRALARVSDEMAKLKQEVTVGGGELLLFLSRVAKTAAGAAMGLSMMAMVGKEGVKGVALAALKGGVDDAKAKIDATLMELKAQFAGFKEAIDGVWEEKGPETKKPLGRQGIQQSQEAEQQLDKEVSLMERLEEIRRRVALEEANDQEKLEQLLDRERELRLAIVGLQEGSADYLEAQIAAEEAGLAVMQQKSAMEEKARQAQEKEAAERKAERERQERELENAREWLRDEQARLTVLREQRGHGEEAAARTSEMLEYQKKIEQLEEKIAKARASGHAELVNQLTAAKQLVQEQAKLANDPVAQAFAKYGRAPRASELRQRAREQERQQAKQENFRDRLVDGLVPTRRDVNGNAIEGLDPLTGERRKIEAPDPFAAFKGRGRAGKEGEVMGPPMPGADVQKQAGQQDPSVAKLDEIKVELGKIERKLDKPLTH